MSRSEEPGRISQRKISKSKKKNWEGHISRSVLTNVRGVRGHDCGSEEATTLRQVNKRPVLTRCEEAGGLSAACCWEVWEKSPGGLINETWIPSGAETQTRCVQIIRQRWQSAGSHRSSQPGGLPSNLSIQPEHSAEGRPGAVMAGNRERRAAAGGVINATILISQWTVKFRKVPVL